MQLYNRSPRVGYKLDERRIKNCVLRWFLKAAGCSVQCTWCGSWFQACGPAIENSRFPNFVESWFNIVCCRQWTKFTQKEDLESVLSGQLLMLSSDLCHIMHRNVIDVETRLVSSRASVTALNSASAELSDKLKQATTDEQVLYAKYQKIQDFNKLTVSLYQWVVSSMQLTTLRNIIVSRELDPVSSNLFA